MPWDQALELVLESKGLGKRLEGNVLLIAPLEEIAARERPEPAPLRRELVQVNYARAADIVMLFQPKISYVRLFSPGAGFSARASMSTMCRKSSVNRP